MRNPISDTLFRNVLDVFEQAQPTLLDSIQFLRGEGYPVLNFYAKHREDGKKTLHYEVAVPGVETEDLSVEINDAHTALHVYNNMTKEREDAVDDADDDKHYFVRRLATRKFNVKLVIPNEYEVDKENIVHKNGILYIDLLPRNETDRTVKINIKKT